MNREERKQYNYWLKRRINQDGLIEKQCSACGLWKIESDNFYYKNKHKIEFGYLPECKKCNGKRSKKWLAENPESKRKSVRKYDRTQFAKERRKIRSREFVERGGRKIWESNNRDKLTQYRIKREENKKHIIKEKEWIDCKEYFDNKCAYCGLPISEHYVKYRGKEILGDFHKDHVIDDGKNDLSNCVPSCKICNTSKHKKTINEWFNLDNQDYTFEKYHKIYLWIRYDYKKYIQKKHKKS